MPVSIDTQSVALRDATWVNIHRADYPWIVARLYEKLRNHQDAEDIASEACIQLMTSVELHAVEQPRAMLMTISKRLVWKQWRRRELEQAWLEYLNLAAEQAVAPSAEERLQAVQTLEAIDAVMQGLSAKAREAFILSQIDGMKHAQIAAELGISVSCVRKYIGKAMLLCYQAAGSLDA